MCVCCQYIYIHNYIKIYIYICIIKLYIYIYIYPTHLYQTKKWDVTKNSLKLQLKVDTIYYELYCICKYRGQKMSKLWPYLGFQHPFTNYFRVHQGQNRTLGTSSKCAAPWREHRKTRSGSWSKTWAWNTGCQTWILMWILWWSYGSWWQTYGRLMGLYGRLKRFYGDFMASKIGILWIWSRWSFAATNFGEFAEYL